MQKKTLEINANGLKIQAINLILTEQLRSVIGPVDCITPGSYQDGFVETICKESVHFPRPNHLSDASALREAIFHDVEEVKITLRPGYFTLSVTVRNALTGEVFTLEGNSEAEARNEMAESEKARLPSFPRYGALEATA